jgi:pimeloyl-ACP methyl ester carboxylesterase
MTNDKRRQTIRRRRGTPLVLRLIRFKFMILQRLWPELAARKALDLWFLTRRFTPPAREHAWSNGAKTRLISSSVGDIQTYHWAEESRNDQALVLLVHGWNGRGLQLGAFVEPLVKCGYQVLCLDLPGHGKSEGNKSNVLRLSQAVLDLQQHFKTPYAIIAHSIGVTAAALALNKGLHCRRFVAISAPLNAPWLIERYTSAIRLKPDTVKRLLTLIERQFGPDTLQRISTDYNLASLSLPSLIIHDRDDTDVPYQHAETLAKLLKGSQLYLTNKLGHRRILYNRQVIAQAVDFVASKHTPAKIANGN